MLHLNPRSLTSDIFIHSLKTAIACMIGVGIASFFHVYNSLWLVLTIIVVMGSKTHFGGALTKSYFYILGTLFGAAIACVTLYFAGKNLPVISLVIFFTVLGFSYIANGSSRIKDAGSLGAITTVTILISQNPTLDLALLRVIEIIGGILIALLVSKFFFPIHARAQLLDGYAQIFQDLIELYKMTYEETKASEKQTKVHALEGKITNDLTACQDLIGSCKAEISTLPFNKAMAESILNYQHRLYRSLIFMYQAINKEPENFKTISELPQLQELTAVSQEMILGLAKSLSGHQRLPDTKILLSTLEAFEKLTCENLYNTSKTEEEIIHIHTVLFCARHMTDEISVLQMLIGNYKQT